MNIEVGDTSMEIYNLPNLGFPLTPEKIQYPGNRTKGYFPLWVMQEFCPLPSDMPFWEQQIKIVLVCGSTDFENTVDYNNFIRQYVNFQLRYQEIDHEFNLIKIPYESPLPTDQRASLSIYNPQIAIDPSLDTDDEISIIYYLAFIYSIAPSAHITLLYQDHNLATEIDIQRKIFMDLRELQANDPFYIVLFGLGIEFETPNVNSDFQLCFLEGLKEPCSRDIEDNSPIQIPLFKQTGNKGWIINYKTNNWIYTTSYFFCKVGGQVIVEEEETEPLKASLIPFSSSTGGFVDPIWCSNKNRTVYARAYPEFTCEDILPIYQLDYNIDIVPENLRKSFRISDVSHVAGPYYFVWSDLVTSTTYSSFMFGVSFAHMRYFYKDGFLPGLPIFDRKPLYIEKMYTNQITVANALNERNPKPFDPLFTYTYVNIPPAEKLVNAPPTKNNPPTSVDYGNSTWNNYRIYPPTRAIPKKDVDATPDKIGLNPWGLGIPNWSSEGWLISPQIPI